MDDHRRDRRPLPRDEPGGQPRRPAGTGGGRSRRCRPSRVDFGEHRSAPRRTDAAAGLRRRLPARRSPVVGLRMGGVESRTGPPRHGAPVGDDAGGDGLDRGPGLESAPGRAGDRAAPRGADRAALRQRPGRGDGLPGVPDQPALPEVRRITLVRHPGPDGGQPAGVPGRLLGHARPSPWEPTRSTTTRSCSPPARRTSRRWSCWSQLSWLPSCWGPSFPGRRPSVSRRRPERLRSGRSTPRRRPGRPRDAGSGAHRCSGLPRDTGERLRPGSGDP